MKKVRQGALYFEKHPAGRGRWAVSCTLGTVLGVGAIFASYVGTSAPVGEVEGVGYLGVGILQILLVPLAVWIGLRPVGLSLREIGLRGPGVLRDAGVGLAVALGFAILQFAVLIPATGGAARSDIVANSAQLGASPYGVVAFIALAWTGGIAEELLFRGHLLTTLRNALGLYLWY